MNKKANELLENTFPFIVMQETFQRWITAKQVSFFTSVCDLKNRSKLSGERTQRKFFLGSTNKYNIQIYVSPVNGAGSITITNINIVDSEILAQNKERKKEILEKIKEHQELVDEIEKKPKWDRFDKVFMPRIKEELENLKKELEIL